MKCPKCQFENREGAKFCGDCGHKFEIACPECGTNNRAGNKFCDECGHELKRTPTTPTQNFSIDEKLTKIQKYLPKGLTEKILSQQGKIEGERKQVTIMFCDIVGFTEISEKLGTEKVYTIMDQIYEILIHSVHDFEGTVNEMTGDGIMALFGAPIALEDASQRALNAAFHIHREMTRFNNEINQEEKNIHSIKMRIGINSGPVVVGTLGNDLRVEFKAVGDTVNLASRMEALAEPGTIYVTESTFRSTEGLFHFEAIGEREVKGKAKPVKIFRVIAPSNRRTRFDVSAEQGLTKFVGRERELELLLDCFKQAKIGRGQIFSLVSEAGMGKSRLLYELRKAISNDDVTILEGKSLSFGKAIAYHPIIDILKSSFNIEDSDKENEIIEKVENGLKILRIDDPSTLPYILNILSVKVSGANLVPNESIGARQNFIIEGIKRITLKGSEFRPLILIIEDLHWSDRSTVDVLKEIFEIIPAAKVLLIISYRPQFNPRWDLKSYHRQVTLNRLSNREIMLMVANLLGTEKIDPKLISLIIEKTEGIPFFLEEFIRAFIGLKIIEKRQGTFHIVKDAKYSTIPTTIHDVIMARVDGLSEKAKNLLQIGSVIGREFKNELIANLLKLSEQELLSTLSELKSFELLFERGLYPESTYIFKHALTHEVVYASLLSSKKKEIHEYVGNAIEKICDDNLDEYCEILTRHFIESENFEKAAEYSKLAAKKSQKAGSIRDAIKYTQKRIFCLEQFQENESTQKKIIDVRTRLALYYMNLDNHAKAYEAVEPIIDLVLKLNYEERVPSIYNTIGCYNLSVKEDFKKAIQYLSDSVKFAKIHEDFITLYLASYNLAGALALNCRFEESLAHMDNCLQLSKLANNLSGISFAQAGKIFYIYLYRGDIDIAMKLSNDVVESSEKSNDIFIKGMAYTLDGISKYFKGDFKKAETSLLEGYPLCRKTHSINWGSLASFYLGIINTEKNNHNNAQRHFVKAIDNLTSVNRSPSWLWLINLYSIRSKVLNKDQNSNVQNLPLYYEKNNFKFIDGLFARLIGETLFSNNNQLLFEAEKWIHRAIEINKTNNLKWLLACDYAAYAKLLKLKSKRSAVTKYLKMAIRYFNECGADGWVEKYEEELATIS